MELRARAFLIDLRGSEQSASLSSRLGYTSDVVAEWEAGRRWPTASEVLRVCTARRIDVRAALHRFDPGSAAAYGSGEDAEVAAWLRGVCGRADPRDIARRLGRPVATVRRWLGGQVRPTLPELLALLDAATGRAEDLLCELIPRDDSPPRPVAASNSALARSSGPRERVNTALQAARRIRRAVHASDVPVTVPVELDEDEVTVEVFGQDEAPARALAQARDQVWRAVASADHARLGRHRPGWLEARCGLTVDQVAEALQDLEARGAVRWDSDRWEPAFYPADLPADPPPVPTPLARLIALRGAQVVVPLSNADLQRVRAMDRRTRAELLAISQSTERTDVLALVRVDL